MTRSCPIKDGVWSGSYKSETCASPFRPFPGQAEDWVEMEL